MEVGDGERVSKHVVDGDEHGLNGIDPLKLAEEVDVKLGILPALGCEDCWALRLRLDERSASTTKR